MEIGRKQGHIEGLRTGQDRVRTVVFIEGREHDHLVAGVGYRHHRGHHRLGAAAGDDDFSVGVDVHPGEAFHLAGQCFAEILGSPGEGILMRFFGSDSRQRIGNLPGRLEVRESLGKVDGVILIGYPGHPADDGIGKVFSSFT